MSDNFIFFWGGPFSQWYKSRIQVGDVTYNCCEQYMMAQKALLFGDTETYEKILKTKNPNEQKALGRTVKNFDSAKWNAVCRKVVYDANLAKFSDPTLREYLISTGDKEIVEASPYDKIWGIGLGQDDPNRFDKSKWQGTNWLGVAIMEVRETLRKQDGNV